MMAHMRTYVGIIFTSLVFPSMAAAAASDEVEYKYTVSTKTRQDCLNGEISVQCDLIRQLEKAKAQTKAPTQQAPKPKAVAAQLTAPAKIPPLITTPFVPQWLPPNPIGGRYACTSDTQGVFVRADPLDNFHYLVDPSAPNSTDSSASTAASASGATISYTNDHVAATQNATINGRLSYLIFGDTNCDVPNTREPFLYGVALAPFISSSGTWTEPLKKTSNSAVQMGADFQAAVSTANLSPILDFSYLYASPYHQTDLRDLADINGILFAWEPVAYQLSMDAAPLNNNPYYGFFWQLRAEAEIVNVNNPGLTGLAKGDHDWFGETVRANLALLPSNTQIDWGEFLAGRVSLIGTAQNFYDTETSKAANYYTAELMYKLGPCVQSTSTASKAACAVQGSSSISFEYDWGTNKDTFIYTKEYLIKLGYAY